MQKRQRGGGKEGRRSKKGGAKGAEGAKGEEGRMRRRKGGWITEQEVKESEEGDIFQSSHSSAWECCDECVCVCVCVWNLARMD